MDYNKGQEAQPPPYEQQQYPPQQGAYPPPQQGGYPQQQQAPYPPPQGYPPTQGSYPPQGYPPPQQGYPPAQYPAQQPVQVVVAQQTPPSNAILAWISCLCFCWPIGLVAVYKANLSDKAAGHGDMNAARRYGEEAKKWAIGAIISWVAGGVIAVVLYFIGMAVSINNTYDRY